MDPTVSLLVHLLIGAIVGMLGQGARVIAGLKTLNDWAESKGKPAEELFVLHRLTISLIIGGLAGVAAVLAMGVSAALDDIKTVLGIAAAGYAGSDFIEAFITRVQPSTPPLPQGGAQNGSAAGPAPPSDTQSLDGGSAKDIATADQVELMRADLHEMRGRIQNASYAPSAAIEGIACVTPAIVRTMFPATNLAPIARNLSYVLSGLQWAGVADRQMVLMALATIRCETEGFVPISEGISRYNTKVHPFDLYEPGTSAGDGVGNTQVGDGARFKGRGYVQLTGRPNYMRIGHQLSLDLVSHPDWANDPQTAGRILGQFLKNSESRIRRALAASDLRTARIAINGGTHGLAQFIDAYGRGERNIPRWVSQVAEFEDQPRLLEDA